MECTDIHQLVMWLGGTAAIFKDREEGLIQQWCDPTGALPLEIAKQEMAKQVKDHHKNLHISSHRSLDGGLGQLQTKTSSRKRMAGWGLPLQSPKAVKPVRAQRVKGACCGPGSQQGIKDSIA